jgi:hypothetical protein
MSRAVPGAQNPNGIFENYFEVNYPPLPLPMIWRVVYHEAVRGNHILWDQQDIESVNSMVESAKPGSSFSMDDSDKKAITKFMASFFSTSDFRDLQGMIKSLPANHKAVAFILYNRAITVWKRWLKTNLH